jgi:hypothetical protein
MLVQALKNLSPLSLLPPEISGGIELRSGKWGINLAAARLNFPDKGLKVQIPVWSKKSVGDKVELLLNNGRVDQHTVTDPVELPERTTLFVPADRLQSGPALLAYRVTRLHQQAEPFTPPLELDVKLELPAGQDTDPGYGHSGLNMGCDPKEIVQDGVDKDSAKDGVDILIQAKPGSGTDRPYENIAVGDVITVSWGGQLVLSDPVTQAQIDDPLNNPIKVHIDEATILKAGDSGLEGLAVTFMVRDRVYNQSEDWCKETRIVVDTGNSRLDAPILAGTDGNEYDLDTADNEDLKVLVWAASIEFKKGDVVIMNLQGITLDGDAIDLKVRQSIDKNPPMLVEVFLPKTAGRALAKTQARFSYALERDGKIIQNSKGRFINFIGELQRLAAPIAEDAQDGALDPDLQSVRIRILFDPLILEGMAIELKWFGKRSDGTTYDPLMEWFFPSEEEAKDPKGFVIAVEGKHLKTLEGGTLKLWYILLSEEGDEIVRRESLHAAPLNVGEPKFELVEPGVLGEKDGTLEPKDLPGGVSKVTCPNPVNNPTKAKDKVTWQLRDAEGNLLFEDFKILNSLSAGKAVDFSLNAAFVQQYFEAHRGETLRVSYQIWRAESDGTSYSNPLAFVIGEALTWKPPSVEEADGASLNPVKAEDTLTVVVPEYTGMRGSDYISVTWTGAPGTPAEGSHTTAPIPVDTVGVKKIGIKNTVVAYNLDQEVTVIYTVIREGTPKESDKFVLTVQAYPVAEQEKPIILEADNQGEGPILDISKLTTGATVHCLSWSLIALYQPVWLYLRGKDASGDEHNTTLLYYPQNAVHLDWLNRGYYDAKALPGYLEQLGDGTSLEVEFKVALDKSTDESKAVRFPVRRYTVKALVELKPDISLVTNSKGENILNGSITTDTSVTFSGTASKAQQIQLYNNASPVGPVVDVKADGSWSQLISGLEVADYSFTAKALNGSGQESDPPRTFSVASTLVIETTLLSLSGQNISIAGSGLDWLLTGEDPAGTAATRQASGGTRPYEYFSSDPLIASVDPDTGTVRSEGNGSATISVRDAAGQTASYPVLTSNVRQILISSSPMLVPHSKNWIISVGGTLISDRADARVFTLNTKYKARQDAIAYNTGEFTHYDFNPPHDHSLQWTVINGWIYRDKGDGGSQARTVICTKP